MDRRWSSQRHSKAVDEDASVDSQPGRGLIADGGEDSGYTNEDSDEGPDADRTNVEVTEAGESTPADPAWEEPDFDEIPEFEIGGGSASRPADRPDRETDATPGEDPTAGRPNEARSPGGTRISEEGTEGYIVALELCARLPDDVRLPAEAADLVPAAVEAELEEDIQSFAVAEFDTPSPTVETLDFVEREGELWLRLRLGIAPEAFADLDPDEIRAQALQELEGMF